MHTGLDLKNESDSPFFGSRLKIGDHFLKELANYESLFTIYSHF